MDIKIVAKVTLIHAPLICSWIRENSIDTRFTGDEVLKETAAKYKYRNHAHVYYEGSNTGGFGWGTGATVAHTLLFWCDSSVGTVTQNTFLC